jgi:hypothetical protein
MKKAVFFSLVFFGLAIAQTRQPRDVVEYIANTLDYINIDYSERCERVKKLDKALSFPEIIESDEGYWLTSCFEASFDFLEKSNFERVISTNKWLWLSSWRKPGRVLHREFKLSKKDQYFYRISIAPIDETPSKSNVEISVYSTVSEVQRKAEKKRRADAVKAKPASKPTPVSTTETKPKYVSNDYTYISVPEFAEKMPKSSFTRRLDQGGADIVFNGNKIILIDNEISFFDKNFDVKTLIAPTVVTTTSYLAPARMLEVFECQVALEVPENTVLVTCPVDDSGVASSVTAHLTRY